MTHRSKEILTACVDEVRRQGGTVVSTGASGASHQVVEYEREGRRGKFFISFSPSDGNAPKNVRQEVRRRFRLAASRG